MNLSVRVKKLDEFTYIGYVLLNYDGSIWHPIYSDYGADKFQLYAMLFDKADELKYRNIVHE